MDTNEAIRGALFAGALVNMAGVLLGAFLGFLAGKATEILAQRKRLEAYYKKVQEENQRAMEEYMRTQQAQQEDRGEPLPPIEGAKRGGSA